MKIKVLYIIFYVFITAGILEAEEFPMSHLKHIADGLNIEGGIIPQRYLQQDQIWSNLCIVLDRPFEDGMEWKELTHSNSYPLKEASILDYNEAQVNFAFANILDYYIHHAHKMLDIQETQMVRILVQVHRNSSGPRHIALLEQLIQHIYPGEYQRYNLDEDDYEVCSYIFSKSSVEIRLCYGSDPKVLGEIGKYKQAHIILSLSLVAGLHPDWNSGSFFIPHEHIPFYLSKAEVSWDEKYSIQNHLQMVLPEIIKNQNETILSLVNEKFRSFNPQKSHLMARIMKLADFKEATLLQVDGTFNPSELPPIYKSEDPKRSF